MERHEASFEIDSKRDSYAVRRVFERIHDTIREETRGEFGDSTDADEVLQAFDTLREEARRPTPGRLTITYERYDAGFDD